MSNFTYELPFTNEKFMKGIIYELKRNDNYDLAHLLKGATVSTEEDGFSYYVGNKGRHNAYAVYIHFYVNPQHIDHLDKDDVKEELSSICHRLIPDYVGYDVKKVLFTIDLSKDFEIEDDILVDLEMQTERISHSVLSELLPEDIKVKGYQMAELYTYLYAVENSLRLFIEKIGKEKYGDEYFEELNIPSKTRSNLEKRLRNAEKKKWLSARGDSNLFYLDFKDLGAIINNNWKVFKKYFPSLNFIISKINEMAECRNLVAHNSLVGETERNLVKTYFNIILKQISENL